MKACFPYQVKKNELEKNDMNRKDFFVLGQALKKIHKSDSFTPEQKIMLEDTICNELEKEFANFNRQKFLLEIEK